MKEIEQNDNFNSKQCVDQWSGNSQKNTRYRHLHSHTQSLFSTFGKLNKTVIWDTALRGNVTFQGNKVVQFIFVLVWPFTFYQYDISFFGAVFHLFSTAFHLEFNWVFHFFLVGCFHLFF